MSTVPEPTGFSGLAELASDVTADVAASESAPRIGAPPSMTARPASRAESGGSVVGGILSAIPAKVWVVGGIFALIWICDTAGSSKSSPRYTARSPSSSSTSPYNATTTPVGGYGATGGSSAASATSSDTTETKPPVGTGRALSLSEVRYCVFEAERIDHMKPLVTDNGRVDIFNAHVRDYNSRCSNFRYRRGTLEIVRREAADRASALEREARLRF